MTAFTALRSAMVERQIISRGVRTPLVLEAMRTVPREAFLPQSLQEFAYDDSPLPIDANQTISQPYIVAFMIEAMNGIAGDSDSFSAGNTGAVILPAATLHFDPTRNLPT